MPGSEDFVRRLRKLLEDGASHTVLLSGAQGSGKTAWAKALAAAWLCQNPQADGACGSCASCVYFASGTHPDFTALLPEKEGGRLPIDSLRENIHAQIALAPQVGTRSVWLIDADALSEAGQNALLKVLEEPPAHAYFVLTVSETAKLLPTLLSRAEILAVPPLSDERLDRLLREEGIEDPAVRQLALTFSRGLPGPAEKIAKDERFPQLRRDAFARLKAFPEHTIAELLTADYDDLAEAKGEINVIIMFWQSFMRDLSLIACGARDEFLMHRDLAPELRALARRYQLNADDAAAVIQILNETRQRLEANGNFEMTVCRMLLLTREEFLHARNSRHQV